VSTFPEILLPPLEVARRKPSVVVAKYWHDTLTLIIPPNFSQPLTWMPRPGYVLVLLFDVFGRAYPVDPSTLEIDTSLWYENAEAGFWHEAPDMRYHWDPFVSSLCDKPYPHFTIVDEYTPYRILVHNPTGDFIYFNISIHIWEMTREIYESVLRPYLLGVFYHYWKQGVELLSRSRGDPLDYLVREFKEAMRRAGIREERAR